MNEKQMSYVYDMDECKPFSMRSGWEEDVDNVSRSPERNGQWMQSSKRSILSLCTFLPPQCRFYLVVADNPAIQSLFTKRAGSSCFNAQPTCCEQIVCVCVCVCVSLQGYHFHVCMYLGSACVCVCRRVCRPAYLVCGLSSVCDPSTWICVYASCTQPHTCVCVSVCVCVCVFVKVVHVDKESNKNNTNCSSQVRF